MRDPQAFRDDFLAVLETADRLKEVNVNEAELRLQVVDEILRLLGWAKADFTPEHHTGAGNYTDYLLRSHGDPLVVVEAKRSGKTFALPPKYRKRTYSAKYLATSCGEDLRDAMQQAAKYCNETGSRFAVVTNGWQWILFRGLASYRQPWTEFDAVLFPDTDSLRTDYNDFWSHLAKDQVLGGSLQRAFRVEELERPQFSERPNAHLELGNLPVPDGYAVVQSLFSHFFDDILTKDNGVMLERCFVEDTSINEYEKTLQSILRENLIQPDSEVETHDLSFENLIKHVETRAAEGARLVLIVGRVGAGKTTFLHYFFKRLEDQQKYAKFIVDLLPNAVSTAQPRADELERIAKSILETISDRYHSKNGFGPEYDPYNGATLRTMFGGVVRRLRDGAKSEIYKRDKDLFERDLADALDLESKDSTELLTKYINHVHGRTKKPFCLVLDNVDRASPEYQKLIYTYALQLSQKVRGVIVVSLRDTTYWRARHEGFLDTRIADTVFHVNAPNLKLIVSKRIKYFRYQLEHGTAFAAVRQHMCQMEPYVSFLNDLMLGEDDGARRMFTCLANRSVRRALVLLRRYGLSPFAWQRAADGARGEHVLRALMLDQKFAFSEDSSPITNVFAAPQEVRGSHFIPLSIMSYLEWRRDNYRNDAVGVVFDTLIRDFEAAGYPRRLVVDVAKRLLATRLIESDTRVIPTPQDERLDTQEKERELDYGDRIALSPAGYHYLTDLCSDRLYQAHCAGDACWYDEQAYSSFLREYGSALQLAVESGNTEVDLVTTSSCNDLWLRYLRAEARKETQQFGASGVRHPWWASVLRRLSFDNPDGSDKPEKHGSSPPAGEPTPAAGGDAEQLGFAFAGGTTDVASFAKTMPTISDKASWQGSTFLLRALWALDLARRANLGPLTASEMARLLSDWSGVRVQNTNMARFFREARKDARYDAYWEHDLQTGRYKLSEAGRVAFLEIDLEQNTDLTK